MFYNIDHRVHNLSNWLIPPPKNEFVLSLRNKSQVGPFLFILARIRSGKILMHDLRYLLNIEP